jgi:hypothetical protein
VKVGSKASNGTGFDPPRGLRIAHGVLPAMGNERLIRLSTAGANVVDQPPPLRPAMLIYRIIIIRMTTITMTAITSGHVGVSSAAGTHLFISSRLREIGSQNNGFDVIAQRVVALLLPLQKPPVVAFYVCRVRAGPEIHALQWHAEDEDVVPHRVNKV